MPRGAEEHQNMIKNPSCVPREWVMLRGPLTWTLSMGHLPLLAGGGCRIGAGVLRASKAWGASSPQNYSSHPEECNESRIPEDLGKVRI